MTATTNNAAANTENSAAKVKPAFYTPDTAAVKVSLWNGTSSKDRAPVLTGMIGDKRVSGFLRTGDKGVFIGFSGEKMEDGNYEHVAYGNVRIGANGYPKLVIRQEGKDDVWAEATKEATEEVLARLGLDVAKMHEKQAEAAAAREAKAAKAANDGQDKAAA